MGSLTAWRCCTDVFEFLPLAAIIDENYLCMHGGLGRELKKIDDIRRIDRKREIPATGPLCDLLWSDPYEGK